MTTGAVALMTGRGTPRAEGALAFWRSRGRWRDCGKDFKSVGSTGSAFPWRGIVSTGGLAQLLPVPWPRSNWMTGSKATAVPPKG
jgi:hypothetical protein